MELKKKYEIKAPITMDERTRVSGQASEGAGIVNRNFLEITHRFLAPRRPTLQEEKK